MSAGKLIPEITLLVQAKESLADGELRGSKGAFPVFGILFQILQMEWPIISVFLAWSETERSGR